jgi:hypothetical protein
MAAHPTVDQVIDAALERGKTAGLKALDPISRWIFLVSEAEVLCDMEGVDSFIDRYGGAALLELTDAYRNLGARELAAASYVVAISLPARVSPQMDRLNRLITDRVGYDFDAICAEVTRQLAERRPS